MTRWPIERSWMLLGSDGSRERVRSSDLRVGRAYGLLGSAGSGKTHELQYLAALDRADGRDVRLERLASLGQTEEGLAARLERLAEGATANTVFYLDALDEVMVPVRTTGLIVERWIRNTLAATRPALRVSCRSAVWPTSLDSAMREIYGKEAYLSALLQPLSESDMRAVATQRGIDAVGFASAVLIAGASVLAQQPLTLDMLLRVFATHGALPTRRNELFAQGVATLASERAERRDDGTAIDMPLDELLEASERLACFTLLSGHEAVDLCESPDTTSLGVLELESLPGSVRRLDAGCLGAIGRCGLCEGDGPRRFRFVHRQFAEYLAGRRLARLLPHQAKTLLATGSGWPAGVAGPLRELAAFAAMESIAIATWITACDPEVVGLSDVADSALRRRATMNLVEMFRRHELTDTHVGHDAIELAGFRYEDAERDLAPLLRERGRECEDVLQCVVKLIDTWGLSSMSDDLASLALDTQAPIQARKSAGYALATMGTPEARRRLLPLIAAGLDDEHLDLKGIALRCNWPGALSGPDLLSALSAPRVRNYYGAYASFLFSLDQAGFDASGHRLAGLAWAQDFVRKAGDHEPSVRIAKRIAASALEDISEPGIAEALARLLLTAATAHAGSPLVPPREYGVSDRSVQPPVLAGRPEVRRRLIDALTAIVSDDSGMWRVANETPSLVVIEDFPWLLTRATDASLPMTQRNHYAECARMLPWQDSVDCVDAWFAVRDIDPIAVRLPMQLCITMDSDEARTLRAHYEEAKRWSSPLPKRALSPAPKERVARRLELCDTQDPRHFYGLCQELTLRDDSTHYGFSRILVTTPGWTEACPKTRTRITDAAKRLLTVDSDEIERARSEPLSTMLSGHITALFLVIQQDPEWVETLPHAWWTTWSWYLLRELHPGMSGEPVELKQLLFDKVASKASGDVRAAVRELATAQSPETRDLLVSLLGLSGQLVDPELDTMLCSCLTEGQVHEDRVGEIAQFVLFRNGDRALPACLSLLDLRAVAASEATAVQAAVALMNERTADCWGHVLSLLQRRPDLSTRVLREVAHGRGILSLHRGHSAGLDKLRASQVGELASLLLESFPPESDPPDDGEVHFVGSTDSARHLRDQLITWLGDQRDMGAVEALRFLEARFGMKYPWLRRPRSRAERSYRLANWIRIDPRCVAELLLSNDKRLIRTGRDAVDGMVAAIEDYSNRLHNESPSDLEDLWNRPRGGHATPKEEERVSDKICVAIRNYFARFAVVADREVQVARRTLAVAAGGAPGSEVDVLCRFPGVGTLKCDPIVVPIEVKLSHNPEARTGWRDQLLNRYMPELGTDLGILVIVWVGSNPNAGVKAIWPSLGAAREEMRRIVASAVASRANLDCRVVLVDAALPLDTRRSDRGGSSKSTAAGRERAKRAKDAGKRGSRQAKKIPAIKRVRKTAATSVSKKKPGRRTPKRRRAPARRGTKRR